MHACLVPYLVRQQVQAVDEGMARPKVQVYVSWRLSPADPALVNVRRQHVITSVVLALLRAAIYVRHRQDRPLGAASDSVAGHHHRARAELKQPWRCVVSRPCCDLSTPLLQIPHLSIVQLSMDGRAQALQKYWLVSLTLAWYGMGISKSSTILLSQSRVVYYAVPPRDSASMYTALLRVVVPA